MLNVIAHLPMDHCGVAILQLIECFLSVCHYWPQCCHPFSLSCLSLSLRFHMNRALALLLIHRVVQMFTWAFTLLICVFSSRQCARSLLNSCIIYNIWFIVFSEFSQKTWLLPFHHHSHIRQSSLLGLVDAKCCCCYATNTTSLYLSRLVLFSPVNVCRALKAWWSVWLSSSRLLLQSGACMSWKWPLRWPKWSWYCSLSVTNEPTLEETVAWLNHVLFERTGVSISSFTWTGSGHI